METIKKTPMLERSFNRLMSEREHLYERFTVDKGHLPSSYKAVIICLTFDKWSEKSFTFQTHIDKLKKLFGFTVRYLYYNLNTSQILVSLQTAPEIKATFIDIVTQTACYFSGILGVAPRINSRVTASQSEFAEFMLLALCIDDGIRFLLKKLCKTDEDLTCSEMEKRCDKRWSKLSDRRKYGVVTYANGNTLSEQLKCDDYNHWKEML